MVKIARFVRRRPGTAARAHPALQLAQTGAAQAGQFEPRLQYGGRHAIVEAHERDADAFPARLVDQGVLPLRRAASAGEWSCAKTTPAPCRRRAPRGPWPPCPRRGGFRPRPATPARRPRAPGTRPRPRRRDRPARSREKPGAVQSLHASVSPSPRVARLSATRGSACSLRLKARMVSVSAIAIVGVRPRGRPRARCPPRSARLGGSAPARGRSSSRSWSCRRR